MNVKYILFQKCLRGSQNTIKKLFRDVKSHIVGRSVVEMVKHIRNTSQSQGWPLIKNAWWCHEDLNLNKTTCQYMTSAYSPASSDLILYFGFFKHPSSHTGASLQTHRDSRGKEKKHIHTHIKSNAEKKFILEHGLKSLKLWPTSIHL